MTAQHTLHGQCQCPVINIDLCQLHAAAPALLAALEDCVRWIESENAGNEDDAVPESARAAIAAAKGEK